MLPKGSKYDLFRGKEDMQVVVDEKCPKRISKVIKVCVYVCVCLCVCVCVCACMCVCVCVCEYYYYYMSVCLC